jgi:uncharacterized protein (DUF2126 family)
MPPHARMSLAQQLLLRALVAWFWREPYRGRGATRLTRWGTGLHDRFLLPTFVQMDFDDVMAELRSAGFAFDAPGSRRTSSSASRSSARCGDGRAADAAQRARALARDGRGGRAGGTVRYVDSSLERLEVKATRPERQPPRRHRQRPRAAAAAHRPRRRVRLRRALPRLAAAVGAAPDHRRARAADLRHRRPLAAALLGGCRYHVAHPGGRNYETFPVNAYEAESRRLARFFRFGHTPGAMQVQPAAPSLEFPFTLDLRA